MKFENYYKKSVKGFGLLKVIMGMGIVSALSVVFMKTSSLMVKDAAKLEVDLAIKNLEQEVISSLANRESCINTFNDQSMNVNRRRLNAVKDSSNFDVVKASEMFSNNRLEVDEINYYRKSLDGRPLADETRIGRGEIQISINKNGNNLIGAKKLVKKIEFMFRYDRNYKALNCIITSSADYKDLLLTANEKACSDLGGTPQIDQDTEEVFCDISDSVVIKELTCKNLGGAFNANSDRCDSIDIDDELTANNGITLNNDTCNSPSDKGKLYIKNSKVYLCKDDGTEEELTTSTNASIKRESKPPPPGSCKINITPMPGNPNFRFGLGLLLDGESKSKDCNELAKGWEGIVTWTCNGGLVSHVGRCSLM